jgi:dTDP-glucose pyrophosphorylase
MRTLGIDEIIVVIGHLGFEIARYLGDGEKFDLKIRYVEQQETLGIAHALGRLEPYISSPFLLFLGDIFFIPKDLSLMKQIFLQGEAEAVLAVKNEEDKEAIKRNFAIIMGNEGLVKRVIEKPRYTPNRLKGCGLYLFDLPIFDAVRRTPRTAMRDEYEITDSIQILINDGYPVKIAEVVNQDVNMSYPQDLLECNLKELSRQGKTNLIGENCNIDPGANIQNSVIGHNVTVEKPIRISNSVVFPNTIVSAENDVDGFILTEDNMIDCKVAPEG